MALISNNFKNDSISTTIDVKPIIVVATQNLETNQYDILDIFSTDNVVLEDNYGNKHQALEILDKISSIKNSVDYESRKLKINTFRFTIKNYYDIKNTLTNTEKYKLKDTGESPLNTLVGSYVILYYKTQSTNVINIDLNPELGDNNCSIMFTGIINRLDQDSKSIKIQAEDYVQTFITDVSVPALSGIDIPSGSQFTNLEQDEVLPMTYGVADRVPVKFIGGVQFVDNYEVDSLPKSTKILHTNLLPGSFVYDVEHIASYKFHKGGADWLTRGTWVGELEDSNNYLLNFYISLIGYKNSDEVQFGTEDSLIVEDLSANVSSGEAFGTEHLLPVTVVGSGSNTQSNNFFRATNDYIQDWLITNEPLVSNKGWDFKWYREDDFEANNWNPNFDFQTHIDNWNATGLQSTTYYSSDTNSGHSAGRWVVLYFNKKVKMSSLRTNIFNTVGMGVIIDGEVIFESELTNVGAGFYMKPVVGNQWAEIMDVYNTSNAYSLHDILFDIRNDSLHSSSGSWEEVGAVCHTRSATQEQTDGNTMFGQKTIGKFNPEVETNKVVLFEYFNDGTENSFNLDDNQGSFIFNENSSAGVYMRFGFDGPTYGAYAVAQESVDGGEGVYASIKGRKSYRSTENLAFMIDEYHWSETLGITPDNVTLPQIINGIDFVIPDNFDNWIDAVEQVELASIESFSFNWFHISSGVYSTVNIEHISINNQYPNFELGQNEYVDSVIGETNIFNLDDNKLLRLQTFWSHIYETMNQKLYDNVMEYEARKYLDEKFAEGVILYVTTDEDDLSHFQEELQGIYNPDFVTCKEEYIGYQEFRQLLRNLSYNIVLSENPDYWASDLVDESPSYFEDIWLNEYADIRKCLKRRILKVMYQSDLNPDQVDNLFNFQQDWVISDALGTPYDMTDTENLDKLMFWLESKYLDDTIKTINESIFDHLGFNSDSGDYWAFERIELYRFSGGTFDEEEIRQYGTWYDYQYQTDGVIEKPVDIIIDILRREMSYGTNEGNLLDLNFYDEQSIYKSRDVYADWKMGFCVHKEIDGKKLIEDILSETMSYFTFTPQGKFSLVTLKERYTIDDVDHFIDEGDILKYKFSKTKKEDLVLQSKFFYRYDNGLNNYPFETDVLKIENLLPDYDGYNYYNLDEVTGYKERKLRYHSDRDTIAIYHRNYLLNNCNQHLKVKIDLPLNYAKVQLSDIVHIPLINNDPVFGVDYSKVQILNGQPIYPAFIVTAIDIKLDKVSIEAYQLHYLDTDGLHGFFFEDEGSTRFQGESSTIVANLNKFNKQFPEIRNWNYLPESKRDSNYKYVQGLEIPYGDVNGDGLIDVLDVISIADHIAGKSKINLQDSQRVGGYSFKSNKLNFKPTPVDMLKAVQLIDVILEYDSDGIRYGDQQGNFKRYKK